MTRIEARIDGDGSLVIEVKGPKAHVQSGLYTADDVTRVPTDLADMAESAGTHTDHWYVNGFALKTVVMWIETEFARGRRMAFGVTRTFTLEVG